MRVGRAHGLDGSFYVDRPTHPLPEGCELQVGDGQVTVVGRKGTDVRPIIRLSGIDSREAAEALRGEPIAVAGSEEPPGEGEWLIEDLVGCRIEGLGEVTGVLEGLSCDVLEVGGELVPLVSDAVTRVDVEGKVIEVNREFLGL